MIERAALWIVSLALVAASSIALAQDSDVAMDDTASALSPPERGSATNPSAEHERFMRELDASGMSDATERANQLEDARRMSGAIDLLFGISR